ncbi:GGDEF domain-containing protein [Devosia sp.]|uniref:GGDEF domain-containing protein n=1 Tax=Devosia sp. TaxID=1871048 RepID=UPI0032657F96
MSGTDNRLTKKAWRRVIRFTGLVTAASIAVSVILTNAIMETISAGINVQGLFVAIALPVILGTPMMFYVRYKHEQLRLANTRLNVLATTDWLTGCLNRGAFTERATQDLTETALSNGPAEGALLIIDADDFKSVNDRFGHLHGDEALRLIAGAIRANVRSTDIVGRLGGEEFGVYLSQASMDVADQVAERIRKAVAALDFTPNGHSCGLSISIGGAVFAKPGQFDQLYRLADHHLYQAKSTGRDRVAMMRAA